MTQTTDGIMSLLRAATSELHGSTEQQTFQVSLGRGELSREDYIHWLSQMYHLHHTLEAGLKTLIENNMVAASVIGNGQFKVPMLTADLNFLGSGPGQESPLPATAKVQTQLENLAKTTPIALIGQHYVLEGSTNGNSFAAKSIRAAFRIEGDAGASYLDPYGPAQREKWKNFKDNMNAASFSPEETDLIVNAGVDMFQNVANIGQALAAQSSGFTAETKS